MSEMRPVRWFVGQEASMLREGGDVLLKLVTREPSNTLALPRDTAEALAQYDDIPWYHVAEVIDYARFMKGGEDYMKEQYDAEMQNLEDQEKEDEVMFGEETTWTRKAIAAILDAKEKIKGIGNPPEASKHLPDRKLQKAPIVFEPNTKEAPDIHSIQQIADASQDRKAGESAADQNMESRAETPAIHNLHLADKPSRPPYSSKAHSFYFYQALPNFYLSPLDIRILSAAFGTFSAFPSTILPRVEHISTDHVIDEELRRRAKYLAHLPYGCEVNFLECDWTGSVSQPILDQFEAEITMRRQRNREKARREEKERQAAEQKERDQIFATARRKRPSMSDKTHFSDADFQPLAHLDQDNESAVGSLSTTPPWTASRAQSSSFATLATPSTSPEAPRTVWGTAVVPPSSPQLNAPPPPEPEGPVDDGWLQGWEDALLDHGENDAVAMVEASLKGEKATSKEVGVEMGKNGSGGGIGGGGKKKKGKKITLMSTNARRGA